LRNQKSVITLFFFFKKKEPNREVRLMRAEKLLPENPPKLNTDQTLKTLKAPLY